MDVFQAIGLNSSDMTGRQGHRRILGGSKGATLAPPTRTWPPTSSRRGHLVPLKGKGSPYSITERRFPELIPVLGSQPAGDVSHKPGGKLPLFSATPATLKRAATNFAAW